jgi:hypothetical protein
MKMRVTKAGNEMKVKITNDEVAAIISQPASPCIDQGQGERPFGSWSTTEAG